MDRWLGFTAGIGSCGLVGVMLGFALAEHREAGYANALDWIGLWWTISSVGMLGVFVAIQPLTTYEWRRLPVKRRWRRDRIRPERSRGRGPAAG